MQMTAAVVNAGLGELTLGLEAAGFQVVFACEADQKAAAIHQMNIDLPIQPCALEEIDVKDMPKMDLLAARIYQASFSHAGGAPQGNPDAWIYKLLDILSGCQPRACFLLLGSSFLGSEMFQTLTNQIANTGYQAVWKVIDVAQATGFPVKERMACLVGVRQSVGKLFQFPENRFPKQMSPEAFLQRTEPVDGWYARIPVDHLPQEADQSALYCWKNRMYVGTDRIGWNTCKVPLVRIDDTLRKMTHREIANFKGFPAEYRLPDDRDRQGLYQKLIYAGNLSVIKQIAGLLHYLVADNPFRSQQAERGMKLERLFGRYLEHLADQGVVTREPKIDGTRVDFSICHGGKRLYFEIKSYHSRTVQPEKVKEACKRFARFVADGVAILVVANPVSDEIKRACQKAFQVAVWDVGNLLWLFEEYEDIQNEFVAALDYAVDQITRRPPTPELFRKIPEIKKAELSWREKLLQIAPGREGAQAYESICIEILKYVLGDYLTLWEAQQATKDGLYRFDLCCKIKTGANQDFFDTIKHYFNTKYLVFEFKNYREKISQKEIYTTEKYLYEKALRKVAIIVSRVGADEHALQAARGSLRETGKLILCLSDNALLEMIDIKQGGEQEPAEFLGALLDALLVRLEK